MAAFSETIERKDDHPHLPAGAGTSRHWDLGKAALFQALLSLEGDHRPRGAVRCSCRACR